MIFNSSRALHVLFLLPGPILQVLRLMAESPMAEPLNLQKTLVATFSLYLGATSLLTVKALSRGTDPLHREENLCQAGPIRFLHLGLCTLTEWQGNWVEWSWSGVRGHWRIIHKLQCSTAEFSNSLYWVFQSHSVLEAWWSISSLTSKRYPSIFHWLYPESFSFSSMNKANLLNPLSSYVISPHLHHYIYPFALWSSACVWVSLPLTPTQQAVGATSAQAAFASLDFQCPALHVTQTGVSQRLLNESMDGCAPPG